jgi:hypothetical protein
VTTLPLASKKAALVTGAGGGGGGHGDGNYAVIIEEVVSAHARAVNFSNFRNHVKWKDFAAYYSRYWFYKWDKRWVFLLADWFEDCLRQKRTL